MTQPETLVDGRHARRERGRAAVIDAVFELLQEGTVPPTVDQVAARAGVSAASVFRYFDGIDDMQRQSFAVFRERFGYLYEIPVGADDSLGARIDAFVAARLRLFDVAAPMLAMARARAIEHEPAAEAVATNRALLADQVRRQFAPELAGASPAVAADLVALVDSMASPESWEIVLRAHGRSQRRVRRLWALGIAAALDRFTQQGSAA